MKLCLGCTALYSGMSLTFIVILFSFLNNLIWEQLVLLAFIMFLPTILRLIEFPIFNSEEKRLRFLYRFLLGSGIAIGILSIFRASNIIIQIVQILIGIILYAAISLKRIKNKDAFSECNQCTFVRSPNCPGFSPFHE